jgi:hypothetical protein
VAADAAGDIFTSDWNGFVYHFDAGGNLLGSLNSNTLPTILPGAIEDLFNVNVSAAGNLIVGTRFGDVIQTNEAFANPTLFHTNNDASDGTFVAFVQPAAAAAPTVDSVVINDGSAQRSLVTSLTITFSTAVTLEPGAIQVQRQGHGLISLDLATSLVGGHTVVVVTFTGSHIINGSLPDGEYTFTVQADKVHDSFGQGLAADYTTNFFRLFGDSNGNGVIDLQDLESFASTFGKSAGDAGYLAYFDYYGTGTVDFGDLFQLLRRLGKRE